MPVLRPIAAAAFITSRHPDLIRRWYRQGLLVAACDVTTRVVLVDLVGASEVDQATQRGPGRPRKPTTQPATRRET